MLDEFIEILNYIDDNQVESIKKRLWKLKLLDGNGEGINKALWELIKLCEKRLENKREN